MRLCDDCIWKLTEDLSSETKKILDNKVLPLMRKRENVSGKELAKAIGLDRTGVKQVIEELKTHLLIDYFYRGRKRVYKLTNTANRYYKLQQNPELTVESSSDSQSNKENPNKQKSASKEKSDEEETAVKQKIDNGNNDNQKIKSTPADKTDDAAEDDNKSSKEEQKSKEVETTETLEEDEGNSQENKDLVWNIT